jgi:hypothetical protein
MTRKIVLNVELPASAVSIAGAPSALDTKVALRLVPLLIICCVVAYLDHINVGFAELQMRGAHGFGDATYDRGTGITFIGYFLFAVLSTLLLQHIGARKTITRPMISWGVSGPCISLISSLGAFYVLRFLPRVFDAGFCSRVVYIFGYGFCDTGVGKSLVSL